MNTLSNFGKLIIALILVGLIILATILYARRTDENNSPQDQTSTNSQSNNKQDENKEQPKETKPDSQPPSQTPIPPSGQVPQTGSNSSAFGGIALIFAGLVLWFQKQQHKDYKNNNTTLQKQDNKL